MDTQIASETEEAPGTPARIQSEAAPFRSPGAASQMSGTTARSSFRMVEADDLEPKFVLKHLRKLCDSSEEFLEHLAPDNGGVEDDYRNIHATLQQGSAYNEEITDFETELNVHLKHFRSEDEQEPNYINVRTLHRALFGTIGDPAASQSGLDLILFLVNLLVFAKHMIRSDRNAKDMWDALRRLDNTFPGQFMPSLIQGAKPTAAGESALLEDTFKLALELRTQLAILVLQSRIGPREFNPDNVLDEVFFRSESSQADDGSLLREWNVAALGGDDSPLPEFLEKIVVERIEEIREYFPTDEASIERGEVVDLEGLESRFPWEPTILRLLQWARLRHRELRKAIEELGGAMVIARNVKQAHENPQLATEQVEAPRELPRKKRTSFASDRRRSSRKFDPEAPVDLSVLSVLKARERDSGVHFEAIAAPQDQQEEVVQLPMVEAQDEPLLVEQQQDDWQPVLGDDENQLEQQQPVDQQIEEIEEQQPVEQEIEEVEEQPPVEQQIEDVEPQMEARKASGPPQNSLDLLKALKAVARSQKENRPVSIFDRQETAQRVEFGDGFDDTQPTPGPSNRAKEKQPAQPSSRKRPRSIDEDSDSEDAFETEDRANRMPDRRRNAPNAKRARINPVSSGAPTSHQPPRRPTHQEPEQEESVSETEAPDMTEEPPPNSFAAQQKLERENRYQVNPQGERKAPEKWSQEATEAFMQYMGIYPRKYSMILQHDKDQGPELLQNRTQINLKDKARNMAFTMIK
jgi:hypothetical protein